MEKQVELSDLATEAMVKSIPAPNQQQAEIPCDPEDKACTNRWIASLSDCC